MNKTQLIAAITDELNTSDDDWTKADVKSVLETFEQVVVDTCSTGEPVTITGFVKFARQDRQARKGRNPATGEAIDIPAKSVAKATALKRFKDTVMESAPKPKKAAKKTAAKARRK